MDNLINFVAFQVGWLVCVRGAARDRPWLGPLVTLPVLARHLWGFEQPGREAWFLGALEVQCIDVRAHRFLLYGCSTLFDRHCRRSAAEHRAERQLRARFRMQELRRPRTMYLIFQRLWVRWCRPGLT
jgi:hypothetical protein